MITGSLGFYTVLSALLAKVVTDLTEAGSNELGRICVVPGEIAQDECECGQLVGAIARWYLSESFPQEQSAASDRISPCEAPYIVARMLINLTRCAPQPIGEAVAPTCEALDTAAQTYIEDAHVVLNAVTCKLESMKSADDIIDFAVVEQVSVGPEGQCVGSELVVLVALQR